MEKRLSSSYRRSQLVQNPVSKEERDDNRDSNEEVEPSADIPDNINTITNLVTAENYLELIILVLVLSFHTSCFILNMLYHNLMFSEFNNQGKTVS